MPSLLFRQLTVATMDDQDRVLTGVNVLVEGDRIAYIGPDTPRADRVIDANGCLAIPGLINTHHHLYQ
ncbi:MAG TPA: hypothetical protein V6D47_12375, partial [Oscillatoriaceae cyanobacterium]